MIKQPRQNIMTRYDENDQPIPRKTNPENKQYLLLLIFKDGTKTFETITGRTATRAYIIENITDININQSQILTEGTVMEDSATIYAFMKHMENYFEVTVEDNFDIEDYNNGDILIKVQTSEGYEYQTIARASGLCDDEEAGCHDGAEDEDRPEPISNEYCRNQRPEDI